MNVNAYQFPIKGGVPLSYRPFIFFPFFYKFIWEAFWHLYHTFFAIAIKSPEFCIFTRNFHIQIMKERGAKRLPNSAIVPNPPQFPETPQEYVKYLLKMRGITVQKMCDELYPALSKSTVDKWLSFQTTETSFSNVKSMVKYLGGSLDYLAQIEAAAPDAPSVPAIHPPQEEKKIKADYPALALLVESYEKEIQRDAEHHHQELERISNQQQDYLNRFRRLNEESRTIYLEQHRTATDQLVIAYDKALGEQEKHLNSAIRGRNWWRGLSLALIVAILFVVGYSVFEFSSIESGITGYILRKHGIISMVGPGGV